MTEGAGILSKGSYKRRRNRAIRSLAVLLAIVITASSALAADAPEQSAAQQDRAKLLEHMRSLAQATKVNLVDADRQPEMLNSPVFRYDDQPRHFIDATMWVWIDRGRPVAFEKIEATIPDKPRWGYCFTSVAEGLIEAKWGDGRRFRSTAPGVEFRPLVNAPTVPAPSSERKLQARKVVRDFSARILTDDRANTTEAMRLLPTPIYEYSDPDTKVFQGAVFGLATSGRNPDLLILVEARDDDGEPRWQYSIARMTIGGVTLKYREETVWQVDFYPPRPTDFPTWTFFYTEREEIGRGKSNAVETSEKNETRRRGEEEMGKVLSPRLRVFPTPRLGASTASRITQNRLTRV